MEMLVEWLESGQMYIYEIALGRVYSEDGLYLFSTDRLLLEEAQGGVIIHEMNNPHP